MLLQDEMNAKDDRIKELEAELAEARKDVERLDWLQDTVAELAVEHGIDGPHYECDIPDPERKGYLIVRTEGNTYRAAIDAAMKTDHCLDPG